MIDPRSQYIIYKEQETELMNQIERKLAAKERNGNAEISHPWYFVVTKYLKEKVFSHLSENHQRALSQSTSNYWNRYI
jgi:hypothetical protein